MIIIKNNYLRIVNINFYTINSNFNSMCMYAYICIFFILLNSRERITTITRKEFK